MNSIQVSSGSRLEGSNGNGNGRLVGVLHLDLTVQDADVVQDLSQYPEGPERNDRALAALRLGVLAIRQAGGLLDSQMIRSEGQRIIAGLHEAIRERSHELLQRMHTVVQAYFDPESGQLPRRLNALVGKDGELERVLGQYLGGDTSTMAQTLARHIGEQSPILRILSPTQTDGLLATLAKTIEGALTDQREKIVGEFSMNQENSALARLIREITDKNGKLKEELAQDVGKVVKEFSLDNEEGALARLVGRVEKAQATITDQFSLDNADSALSRLAGLLDATHKSIGANLSLDDEKSPLSRLRQELLKVIEEQGKANAAFQTDVRAAMAAMNARKQAAKRSTGHGVEFEDAVGEFLLIEAQKLNDQCESVGDFAGRKPRCKVGDHLLTLGADSAAPGAAIVFEAKEKQGVKVKDALAEIAEARENRDAQVGVFVFSRNTAPEGIEPLQRHGNDLIVVWDSEDPQTDVYLRAAVSVARALVVRKQAASSRTQAGVRQLEESIARITKDAAQIEQIGTWAQTAKSSSQKIIDEAEKVRADLGKQVEQLRDYVSSQKSDSQAAIG